MKSVTLITALAFAVLLAGCEGESQKTEAEPASSRSPEGSGLLVIAYAPDSADTFAAFSRDSLTALDWLEQACDSAAIPLGVEHFSFGDLVARVGLRKNGDGGNWLYKVNGGMVPASAGSHFVSPDDSVTFFFE